MGRNHFNHRFSDNPEQPQYNKKIRIMEGGA